MQPFFRKAILAHSVILGLLQPARSAQIPQTYLDSVVALGSPLLVTKPDGTQETQWSTEGTGFFYATLVQDDPAPENRRYETYLVTAKHVVLGHLANQKSDLHVRLNPKDPGKPDQEFSLPNQPPAGTHGWFFHPNPTIDVAIVQVSFPFLREQGFDPPTFVNDANTAGSAKMKELGVSAGDGVFVLGFPMNLAGIKKNYVIVRQGNIARVNDMLDGAVSTFMIDSHVFPGNSGGPVVLKAEISSIQGTKAQANALLIGLVIAYVPYTDTAFSQQTGQARISFQENSGLAEVIPTDYIDQAITAWRAKRDKKP
ncbi:MAG: trypsin-like peptidase domain-containing protein [Alphaproteobacteria bacterium]|nr:trypsin-like peptidase domain-containing protein [Alphaproteobacteria bacterium]